MPSAAIRSSFQSIVRPVRSAESACTIQFTVSPLVVEKWLKTSPIVPIFTIFKYTDAGAALTIRAPFDGAFKLN